MTPKQPPHSSESEQTVLGALMVAPDMAWEVFQHVAPADFFRHDHRVIATALQSLHGARLPLDAGAVVNYLRDKEQLEEIGGHRYVWELVNYLPAASSAPHHAAAVRDHAKRRAVIALCGEVGEMAFTTSAEECAATLFGGVEGMNRSDGRARRFAQCLDDAEETIRLARERRAKFGSVGVPTGLPALDQRVAIYGPRLVLFAGQPGTGKTALLNQIAHHSTARGFGGLICSLEMGADELVIRALSSKSGANFTRILHGEEEAAEQAFAAAASIGDPPLWIDTETYSLAGICSQIALHRHRYGIQWAAVDYIGLVEAERFNARHEQVNHIARTLKLLCKRLDMPIIVLSQLTRSNEREDREPSLTDLRDAGESDADTVVLMHTPKDKRHEGNRPVVMNIPKNRGGRIGRVPEQFQFVGAVQRFEQVAGEYETSAPHHPPMPSRQEVLQ